MVLEEFILDGKFQGVCSGALQRYDAQFLLSLMANC